MTGYFAQHAARLAGYGYDVIPISRHDDPSYTDPGKQPAQRHGWQRGCLPANWASYGECGVGILCKTTPALDIDVLDAELAEEIQAQAERVLGDGPIRIGRAPKRLMPFRLVGEQIGYMKVSWRGLGDELHEATRPPHVELLTTTQFVALGIHPSTRRPYQWIRDPDLDLPHGMLPGLDRSKAEKFMRALEGTLKDLGATEVKLRGVRREAAPMAAPRYRPRGVVTFMGKPLKPAARSVAEEITDALRRRGNPDEHYDDWIKIGHAIRAELPGNDGLAIWGWWSSLSSKNRPDVTRRKWATFNPHTVTAATIFWRAGR
jgi:Casjensviridae DNA primase